jgi:hypothetical protein
MTARTPNEILRARGGEGNGHRLAKTDAMGTVQALPRANPARLPKPMWPLGIAGNALWNKVWSAGLNWISPESDGVAVYTACEIADEMERLKNYRDPQVMVAGTLTAGEKRSMDTLRDLRKHQMDILNRLGFTPTDRANLSVGEVVEEDPLAKFRADIG